MELWIAFFALLSGYLLGGLSFARLVGRLVAPGQDLTQTLVDIGGGDKQVAFKAVSATSITMRKGPGYGCLTSLLDALKVFLPTLAWRWLFPQADYYLIAAAAGVAGHNFPIYYGFKGGLGISPVFGGLLVIDWAAIPVTSLLSALIGYFIVRDLFLVYAGTPVLLIPWLWWRFHDLSYVLYAAAVCVLFWVAAIPTLKEYLPFKRSGSFDGANLFETGHTATVVNTLRKRGILKKVDAKKDQPPEN